MNNLKRMIRLYERLIFFLAICGGIIFACITLLVVSDVCMRYLFNSPIEDVNEITEHSLVFITFLTAPWILKKDQHVKMDGVIKSFKPESQSLVNSITSFLGAAICLIFFITGFQGTWDYYSRGLWFPGGMRIQQYPILSVLVLSYFVLFIQFLRRGHGFLKMRSKFRNTRQDRVEG